MKTLEEAWHWYEGTRRSLLLTKRLGRRHWINLDWDGPLGRDETLRSVDGPALVHDAESALAPLEDLAVLVLFSVFESEVRAAVGAEVEAAELRHVALRSAARDVLRQIADGGFFAILDTFKGVDVDLVEQVNQVRRYRNWVAHGRKGDQPNAVDPRIAFIRLSRFLDVVRRSSGAEDH